MKQMRFFEVPKSDWAFLEKYQKAKNEYKGWIEIHESYQDLETRIADYLNENNSLSKNDVIDIEDFKIKKKLSEDLKNIQKELQWIPDQIESIRIWLEYNRERAVNIN